jgi:hypothetical protein
MGHSHPAEHEGWMLHATIYLATNGPSTCAEFVGLIGYSSIVSLLQEIKNQRQPTDCCETSLFGLTGS